MSKPWVVLKFGGTSVATAEYWKRIAERIRTVGADNRVIVVASALAGTSDCLLAAIDAATAGEEPAQTTEIREHHRQLADEIGFDPGSSSYEDELDAAEKWLAGVQLTREAPPRLVARIMACGELASTRLGVSALAHLGLEVRWVDARDLLISTPTRGDDDSSYLRADIEPRTDPSAIEDAASGDDIVLTQGFIASTSDGDPCLLGRGGSDTSAALIATLAGAERLEIWSDVHGLFTADPRLVPGAHLIERLGYREAEELAAMGARVLHPRCIRPLAWADIPLEIRCIDDPNADPGTRIGRSEEDDPTVTAVTCRTAVTLVSVSTAAMLRTPGFLARVFAPLEDWGISVDLVATSQSAISFTLDAVPGGVEGRRMSRLVEYLRGLGEVTVIHPCAVVSVVGRRIRAVLHELGPTMEVFRERPVHLVSDSTEDLNFSFVVDEDDAAALIDRLHERLFPPQVDHSRFGPTWMELRDQEAAPRAEAKWWQQHRTDLLALAADGRAHYVYHLQTVAQQAGALAQSLLSVERIYYSMKANPHPRILETVAAAGLGIECVSAAEARHARDVLGDDVPLLFTPNFCPLDEYEEALALGAVVTVDGPSPLLDAAGIFDGQAIGVRIDTGRGLGHHEKVKTAGAQAKFGQPLEALDALGEAAAAARTRIVGLHAHIGSGILRPHAWQATGRALGDLLSQFPDVAWLNLGGGLGVPERPGQQPLDLHEVEIALSSLRRDLQGIELHLEPGRFVVSEAGVLVAPVTQVRRKGGTSYVGLATGMNSLLRPALYGAWHGIHNLTRLGEPSAGPVQVVGPICETGDVLGRDRLLPETRPGDIVLIENAGAYGAVMSSRYNLRDAAEETVL